MAICGVYKITNTINNKCYIGQSKNIQLRWKRHKENPLDTRHYPLYRAFSKYGIDNFSFEVLKECSEKDLDRLEIEYISIYDSYNNGYNQTIGGKGKEIPEPEDIKNIKEILKNSETPISDIAKDFSLDQSYIYYINRGYNWFDSSINYPIRNLKKEAEEFFCLDCNIKISNGSLRCTKCNAKDRRKVERPSKEILVEELTKMNFQKVATKYGVTASTIRRWCDDFGISRKASDYKKDKNPKSKNKNIKILKIDIETNKILNEFSNYSSAAKSVGKTDGTNISRACRGLRETAFGYKWELK